MQDETVFPPGHFATDLASSFMILPGPTTSFEQSNLKCADLSCITDRAYTKR